MAYSRWIRIIAAMAAIVALYASYQHVDSLLHMKTEGVGQMVVLAVLVLLFASSFLEDLWRYK